MCQLNCWHRCLLASPQSLKGGLKSTDTRSMLHLLTPNAISFSHLPSLGQSLSGPCFAGLCPTGLELAGDGPPAIQAGSLYAAVVPSLWSLLSNNQGPINTIER